VTVAEAAPPQAAPLSHTGTQVDATAASADSELKQLLQKMTGDIANLERAMEQLQAKQDQIAGDNAKAIEQLKMKQEDMARLLAKISGQSALPKTFPPWAGPTQSPQSHNAAAGATAAPAISTTVAVPTAVAVLRRWMVIAVNDWTADDFGAKPNFALGAEGDRVDA
jgi:hypothetical protein